MDIKRLADISPMSIFMGMLITQIAGAVLLIGLLVPLGLIYRYDLFVVLFENPLVILITMILTLLSISIGGYGSMLFSKKALINPFIVGVLNLLINYSLMHKLDFKYGADFLWLVLIALVLIVPSAVFGGYYYQNKAIK